LREGLTPLALLFFLEEVKKGGEKKYGARDCDIDELVTRGSIENEGDGLALWKFLEEVKIWELTRGEGGENLDLKS
jgi:hypothetical protein